MNEYEFETEFSEEIENKVYVLIIYDIVNNKKRTKLAKHLQGYGFRIQKSCFEAMITKSLYHKLRRELENFAGDDDSIRMYKIIGKGQVTSYGSSTGIEDRELIII